jgi:type I restriction enzyme M protein
MLSFLFLRYLSGNYEESAKKELGADYPQLGDSETNTPLAIWYEQNQGDVPEFEKQMRRKVHYVIKPEYLWRSVAKLARMQNTELLETLEKAFNYIENKSLS